MKLETTHRKFCHGATAPIQGRRGVHSQINQKFEGPYVVRAFVFPVIVDIIVADWTNRSQNSSCHIFAGLRYTKHPLWQRPHAQLEAHVDVVVDGEKWLRLHHLSQSNMY